MAKLTHLDDNGAARMVDIGEKAVTRREAHAEGFIEMSTEAIARIREGRAKKGDVLAAARIAGIMAAKRTSELIPLCHQIPLDSVSVDFKIFERQIGVFAKAVCSGKTGVEMEALTATSVALLTIYDMIKAADPRMTIASVRLTRKTGGKSGDFVA